MSAARYIVGDTRDVVASMPDGSVDLVLTSPPFLALRSYLPADHPDKHREIGSEATPAEFLQVLLELAAQGSAASVIAVGTDGRRLAKMEGPAAVKDGVPAEAQPIVPARAMQLIERCLGDASMPVQVAVRTSEILVKTGPTTISARLVDGRFPRWRDVFPDRPDAARVKIVAGPLLAAVRQAAIVTSEQSKGVDFSFEPGQLMLAARSAESGESRIELPIEHAGTTVKIKLDPRFMSEFLRVLDAATTVTLELTDSQSACVCRTDDGYGYVIMPLAAD
jgi:DNA polymerase-3 subunit beta